MWYALFILDYEETFPEDLLALLRKLLSMRKRMGKDSRMEKPHNIFGIDRIREGLGVSLSRDALVAPNSLTLSHCDGEWLSHVVFHRLRKTCDITAGVTWIPRHVSPHWPRLSRNHETLEANRKDYELQGPVPCRKGLYCQGADPGLLSSPCL